MGTARAHQYALAVYIGSLRALAVAHDSIVELLDQITTEG
jgi:hypothetical protein